MRETGWQCDNKNITATGSNRRREAALEEAATMLETGELRGTEQDIHKIGALFISVAKYIRSLK